MREIPFATVQDINKNYSNREIVLFGAGNIAEKTSRLITDKKIGFITDNAANLWGVEQLDVTIQSPEELKKAGNSHFVIICTTSFTEVSAQLSSFGLKPEQDFIVSPILNDLRIISELESIDRKIMFSSGSPVQDSPKYGGGIYEMTVRGDEWSHEKKISDNCYGIIRYKDNYISVSTELGIFEFNSNYEVVRNFPLPPKTRGHGVGYSPEHNKFFVVGSYLDGVMVLSENFEVLETIHFSEKYRQYGVPYHHCNDCCVVGNSLFVTMFSASGNWKLDVFDGAVIEIDITTGKILGPVIQDLWMPHNISFHAGSLTVLDSLRGALRKNNAQIVGEFPAFTRGLDHDGVYYYIGQSRNRNFSKNIGISNNTSIDASIIVFDEQTKVSRSLQLPPKISEIHSILVQQQV